jgi:hypothetical protein
MRPRPGPLQTSISTSATTVNPLHSSNVQHGVRTEQLPLASLGRVGSARWRPEFKKVTFILKNMFQFFNFLYAGSNSFKYFTHVNSEALAGK